MSNPRRKEELRQIRIAGAQAFKDGHPRQPPRSAFMDQVAWVSGYDAAQQVTDYAKSLPSELPPTNTYHIAFKTTDQNKGGYIKALKITIEWDVMDSIDTARVDLAGHPEFKRLQEYVLSNQR